MVLDAKRHRRTRSLLGLIVGYGILLPGTVVTATSNENAGASSPLTVAATADCVTGLKIPSGAGIEISTDGGVNWTSASTGCANGNWHSIPDTVWLCGPGENSYARFRVKFVIPPDDTGTVTALGPSATVQIHADNAATVYVNATQIGAQPDQEVMPNFQDPAESYSTSAATAFAVGDNYVYIDDHNFTGVSGVDFMATIACQKKIASVKWEAINRTLTANPNTGGGKGMFPDKDSPSDQTVNDTVRVKATTCPAMQNVTVYFKSFDVDDPTGDAFPVDSNGSQGGDNRSTAIAKQGRFVSTATNTGSATTDANGVASIDFQVTRQPGDNFRVAAACNQSDLAGLTDDNVPGDNNPDIAGFSGRVSEMLTVWRRLHVELDSMGPVANNFRTGKIIGVSVGNPVPTFVKTDQTLADGSPHLGSDGNGRFENGTLTISTGATITPLTGNDATQLKKQSGFTIPFVISKPGKTDITGNIGNLITNRFILNISAGTLTTGYAGGTLSVAGAPQSISQVNTPNAVFVSTVNIPFTVHDDDMDNLLQQPKYPDVTLLDPKLKPAFITPIYDLSNPTPVTPFGLNVASDQFDPNYGPLVWQRWDTDDFNATEFWVAYILEAYQEDYPNDNDPTQDPHHAVGVTSVPFGGSMILLEAYQVHEGLDPVSGEPVTVVHEVGHALARGGPEQVTDGSGNYSQEYLDLIRNCLRPLP